MKVMSLNGELRTRVIYTVNDTVCGEMRSSS